MMNNVTIKSGQSIKSSISKSMSKQSISASDRTDKEPNTTQGWWLLRTIYGIREKYGFKKPKFPWKPSKVEKI